MENKKNYKNNSTSNLDQIKPKLIKRDIKIVPNKKENIIPSVFNSIIIFKIGFSKF